MTDRGGQLSSVELALRRSSEPAPDRSELPAAAQQRLGAGWLVPLVLLTVLTYLGQLPYLASRSGAGGLALPVLGLGWFGAGIWCYHRGRRAGTLALSSFLVAEVGWYLAHNAATPLVADLLLPNPLALAVSLAGYVNAVVAVCYLIALLRRGAGDPASRS